jgi:glycerol-3-phosphate dehydrogenase (NAD(P)+)
MMLTQNFDHSKIVVVGSGSWGTALAILLAKNGHDVCLWGHNTLHISQLLADNQNKKYLPGVFFPQNLSVCHNLSSAALDKNIAVMAIPSHTFRENFSRLLPFLNKDCILVSAIKGIENETLSTMTQIMDEIMQKEGKHGSFKVGVLSGPSFAKEVAMCFPTAVTIGFKDLLIAKKMQKVFGNGYFRVYASCDVIGLEISAAFKNIIAIAYGVCEGLGYGFNTRAALITRGLAEMKRMGKMLETDEATFSGLSGLGDLVLTCTGDLSRNRFVGLKLGHGKKLQEIIDEMSMVAEGIKSAKSIYSLAKNLNIETPILEQVYKILYENKSCLDAVDDLLTRELKVE